MIFGLLRRLPSDVLRGRVDRPVGRSSSGSTWGLPPGVGISPLGPAPGVGTDRSPLHRGVFNDPVPNGRGAMGGILKTT